VSPHLSKPSLEDSLGYLYHLHMMGVRLGLENTLALSEAMGNPHTKLKFIHIAGTNGKGSVAASLSSILQKAGVRTGLYTSPHLVKFSERIRIQEQNLPDETLRKLLGRLCPEIDRLRSLGYGITFFEATTILALLAFHEANVGIVVLETGLGGRLDATNIVDPQLSLITSISYDHEAILGNTLPAIAGEKAGIIKPGKPVLSVEASEEIQSVFQKKADEVSAPLEFVEAAHLLGLVEGTLFQRIRFRGREYRTPLLGQHQLQNVALAIRASEVLAGQGWGITPDHVYRGIEETRWPGRFEVISQNPWFILDGAHNEDGLRNALAAWKSLTGTYPGRIIFGVLKDKQLDLMISQLEETGSEIWLVPVASPKSTSPDELASRFQKIRPRIWPSAQAALEASHPIPARGILLIGSLYLVGEILSRLRQQHHELALNG